MYTNQKLNILNYYSLFKILNFISYNILQYIKKKKKKKKKKKNQYIYNIFNLLFNNYKKKHNIIIFSIQIHLLFIQTI